MFVFGHIVAALVLVFLGYIALWSASQNTVPKEVAKFGKVLSIILYVFAGLVIIFSLTCPFGRPGMMGHGKWHHGWMKGDMDKECSCCKEEMKGMECMKGMKGMECMKGMKGMQPSEKGQEQKENTQEQK